MNSIPKIDKPVSKNWKQQPETEALHATIALGDTSIDESPEQSAKKIEIAYLEDTGEQPNNQESSKERGNPANAQTKYPEPIDMPNDIMDEEHAWHHFNC